MKRKHFQLSAIALSLALIGQAQADNTPVSQYTYDENGNLTSQSNALGETTGYTYDRLDRLTRIEQPLSETIQLQHNILDQPTQITDPRQLNTSYQRNGLGELTQQTSPDTGLTKTTTNSKGQLDTRTDAKGQKATYSYDVLGRVTKITYADTGNSVYGYDEGDYAKGHLTSTQENRGGIVTSQQWVYSQGGFLTKKTQTVDGLIHSVQYAYDNLDRLSKITYPSGKVFEISYQDGDIASLTYNGQTVASNIQTDALGGLKQLTLGSGTIHQRSLDPNGRLASYTLNGQTVQLSYDAANRITGQIGPDGTWQYSYDPQNRLIKTQHGTDTTEYQYDPNGNRTQITQNGQSTTLNIDPTNNREAGKTHDANGSLIDDGSRQFVYRYNARMQSVRNQGDQTIYQYNALGERVRKSNNQEQTDYLYDEEGKLLGEYGKSGQAKAEYLWLGDIPVGVVKFDTTGQQATLYYVESDQLNTPRMVTTQNKKVMWQWFSEPFGSTQVVNNPAGQGPFTYNLRFPGQYYDRESGLHYNYYRDYDPATGRYVQSDPIGLAAGVNTYVYVGGNPLTQADPTGLCPACAAAGGGGATGGSMAAAGGAAGWDGQGHDYSGGFAISPQLSFSFRMAFTYVANPTKTLGSLIGISVSNAHPGYWPGDKGAAEWGRRNGLGEREGRGRFHGIKQNCKGKPQDKYLVNPDTGEVMDPEGEVVGNLEEVKSKRAIY